MNTGELAAYFNAQEACYDAGWSDAKAMAAKMVEDEGQCELADRIRAMAKPPCGDK